MARQTIGSLKEILKVQNNYNLFVRLFDGDDAAASVNGAGTFNTVQAAIDYAREKIPEKHRVQIHVDASSDSADSFYFNTTTPDEYIVLNRPNTELIGYRDQWTTYIQCPIYVGNLTYDAFKAWYEAGGASWTFDPATNSYSYTGQSTLGLDTVVWEREVLYGMNVKLKNFRISVKELIAFKSAPDSSGDANLRNVFLENFAFSSNADNQHWFYGTELSLKDCDMNSKSNSYGTIFENCELRFFGDDSGTNLNAAGLRTMLSISTDASSYAGNPSQGRSIDNKFVSDTSGLIFSNQKSESLNLVNCASEIKAKYLSILGNYDADGDLNGKSTRMLGPVKIAGDVTLDSVGTIKMENLTCSNLSMTTGGTITITDGTVRNNVAMDAGTNILTNVTIVGDIDLDGGTLTLNNCHVKGNIDVALGATLNINGGQILNTPTGDGTFDVPESGSGSSEHFLAFATTNDFPAVGEDDKLYLSEANSLLYRYALIQPDGASYDWVVGFDPGDDFDSLEAAVASASNGDKIRVKQGYYNLSSELNIDKELEFYGDGKSSTIVDGYFSTGSNSTLIRVSANNVLLSGMNIGQLAEADNFCISGETTDPARPGDKVRIENFALVDCEVRYVKHGIDIRGANTLIKDTSFALEYTSGSMGTRYPLMFSHSEGTSFISGCNFQHPLELPGSNRLIYLRGSGTATSDSSYSGKIYIENNTIEGNVVQFINHDNLEGTDLEVYLLNNDTRAVDGTTTGDTNAFFVSVGSNPDIYSKVVAEDNKLENTHNSEGLGKGLFFLDTTNTRSTPLPVFARNNQLGNLNLRTDVVTGQNSEPALFTIDSTVDYASLGYNPYDFSTDFSTVVLDDTPTGPSATPDAQLGYAQVSMAPVYHTMSVQIDSSNLSYIDLEHVAIPESIVLSVGRNIAHLNTDFEVTEVDGVSRVTWIGPLAQFGSEELKPGDTIFVTYAYNS